VRQNFILVLLAIIALCNASLFAQSKRRDSRDLTRFEGRWEFRDSSRRLKDVGVWTISVENDRLKILHERPSLATGRTITTETILAVGKQSETNIFLTSNEKSYQLDSKTSWDGNELVRRYSRRPSKGSFEKMYVSERFSVLDGGQRLVVLYLYCPEDMWPTNPGQENAMCFDDKWTFLKSKAPK
jgi:hypothetical protein